jgi:hypothetical protein
MLAILGGFGLGVKGTRKQDFCGLLAATLGQNRRFISSTDERR